jgi:hypothetical protein
MSPHQVGAVMEHQFTLPSKREAQKFIESVVKDGLTPRHDHGTLYIASHIIRRGDVQLTWPFIIAGSL